MSTKSHDQGVIKVDGERVPNRVRVFIAVQFNFPAVFSALVLVLTSQRPLMDAEQEAELTGRLIRRLQNTLPNDLESEAQKILQDEPGCTKRHIIFAIGYCRGQFHSRRSQGVVWTRAAKAVQLELIRGTTGPPHYTTIDLATDE